MSSIPVKLFSFRKAIPLPSPELLPIPAAFDRETERPNAPPLFEPEPEVPPLDADPPPWLSCPDPVLVRVIVIGAIVTAPPKLTIPPEMVPMVIPSWLYADN